MSNQINYKIKMSEQEVNNTKNLLSHVHNIKNKYDELAEYTGENYNIFNVLNIYHGELSHSAIIGNLLNCEGKHGQKDVFLKLFLEEISKLCKESEQEKILQGFETKNSKAEVEKYAGIVNHENGEGGRIDILISDGKNNIIIENKIWAGDQNLQLIRYNNYDLNAPIIYLTLDGKPPSKASIQHEKKLKNLIAGQEFVCVSYRENIKIWLEKCIKEMANKPIIRESLNQYLVLVKQLTNQSTNSKMSQDIINYISQDKNNLTNAKLVFENYQKAVGQLVRKQVELMIAVFIEHKLDKNSINISRSKRDDGAFITIKKFLIENVIYDLGIHFELQNDMYMFCVIQEGGLRNDKINTNSKFKVIRDYLDSKIDNLDQSINWTIGNSKEFKVGLNKKSDFYFDDNHEVYQDLAEKIVNLIGRLNA